MASNCTCGSLGAAHRDFCDNRKIRKAITALQGRDDLGEVGYDILTSIMQRVDEGVDLTERQLAWLLRQ